MIKLLLGATVISLQLLNICISFYNHLNIKKIMADLSELEAAVAKDTTVDESAITLLNGLKAALDAAGTDPAKLKALSDQLGSNSSALADAITANTPSE